jgi:hypothetical protein
MAKKKRNYKREYALYHGKAKQIKRRSQRNQSRRKMVKAGLVSKGDGKDVDHRDHDTSNMSRKNLRIMSKYKNRSIK